MQSKAKSNSVITHRVVAVDNEPVLIFTVLGVGDLRLEISKISADVRAMGLLNGLVQRVSDKAAIGHDRETGKPATPQQKFDAMAGLVSHWHAGGDWRMQSGEKAERGGIILRAIAEYYKLSLDAMRAKIKARAAELGVSDRAYMNSLAKTESIRNIIGRLEEESGQSGLDGDAELDRLMDE